VAVRPDGRVDPLLPARLAERDLIAGFAVAALIVPKNLGYAGIAGIPLQNGLYAAAAGAILYAVFGTSRQISTGPSSGLAAVAASAVVAAGITGIQNIAAFVAMITLVSGILFLLLAVLKTGWIAQFLSRAVRARSRWQPWRSC
jgi:SulP family sulfate permease